MSQENVGYARRPGAYRPAGYWAGGESTSPELGLDVRRRQGMEHHHDYIELEHNGQTIPIDVGIAPVIEALWARGIETTGSCEDWTADVFELPECTAAIAFVHA